MESDEKFLHYIAGELVDNNEAIKVERTVDQRGVLLTLTVAPNERGKIIGREGKMKDAIRTILRAVGRKHNAFISFRLNEDDDMGRK